MRKVVFGGANSLDNYLARRDHAVDWLRWNDEELLECRTFSNGCVLVKYRVKS